SSPYKTYHPDQSEAEWRDLPTRCVIPTGAKRSGGIASQDVSSRPSEAERKDLPTKCVIPTGAKRSGGICCFQLPPPDINLKNIYAANLKLRTLPINSRWASKPGPLGKNGHGRK